jgi:hypothetical protein
MKRSGNTPIQGEVITRNEFDQMDAAARERKQAEDRQKIKDLDKKMTMVGSKLVELSEKMSAVQKQTKSGGMGGGRDRSELNAMIKKAEAVERFDEERESSFKYKAKQKLTVALFGRGIGGMLNERRDLKERRAFMESLDENQEKKEDTTAENITKESTLGEKESYEINSEAASKSFLEIKGSIEKMSEEIKSLSSNNKEIFSVVKLIQNRVSPKDVTVKSKVEGEDPTKIRFDPFAPAGKQYSALSEKGRKARLASKEEALAASMKVARMRDEEAPTNEFSEEKADLAQASKIDIAAKEEEDPNTARYEKIIEELKDIKELLEKQQSGGFGLGGAGGLGGVPKALAGGAMIAKLASALKNAIFKGAGKKAAAEAAEAAAKKAAAKKAAEAAGKKVAGETAEAVGKKVAGETAEAAGKKVAGETAEAVGKEAVEDAAKKAAEATAKTTAKGASKEAIEKAVTGGVAKLLAKKIPFIGAAFGLGFGAWRLLTEGDATGAALEVASGLTSLVPGPGTAAGLAIDAGIIARDISRELGVPPEEALKMVNDEIQRQLGNVEQVGEKIEEKSESTLPAGAESTTQTPPTQPTKESAATPTSTAPPTPQNAVPQAMETQIKSLVPNVSMESLEPNSTGYRLDKDSTQVAQNTKEVQIMQPIVVNKPAPPSQTIVQQQSNPGVFVSLRHTEPALATYRASIFDHPVTHPGNFMM